MNFNAEFKERLLQERKRLKLTQQDIEMWGRYERESAMPGADVLPALIAAGIDVQYLLTGAQNTVALADDERALLAQYRATDASGKTGMLCYGAALPMAGAPSGPLVAADQMRRALRVLTVFMAASKNDQIAIECAVEVVVAGPSKHHTRG